MTGVLGFVGVGILSLWVGCLIFCCFLVWLVWISCCFDVWLCLFSWWVWVLRENDVLLILFLVFGGLLIV